MKRRESKWLDMTKDDRKWNKFVVRRFLTVKYRCRKGIPHSVRGKAWFYLCGGHKCLQRDPGGFERLSAMEGDANVIEEITRDLHRQFPNHFMFAESDPRPSSPSFRPSSQVSNSGASGSRLSVMPNGQEALFKLLKAYSILKPTVGYCQAQAPIACTLLMLMPPEHAFWSFLSINDLYLVGYFDHGLESIQLHGDMLMAFIKHFYPRVHKILKKHGIEPVLFMTDWFMCLYTRTLPWPMVLRIWDMFMCEGIIVAFKVAIILVGTVINGERKKCTDLYTTLTVLKNIPEKYLVRVKKGGVLSSDTPRSRDGLHYFYPLLDKVNNLDLTENDLKREHAIQANERRIKRKQTEETKRALKSDTTDNGHGLNGGTPTANGTPKQNGTPIANGTPVQNGNGAISRPSSSLSRASHRHKRAPFIEFEFSLGGKVLTNKPEYKPAYGQVPNGHVANETVPNGGHTFVDGPSGRNGSKSVDAENGEKFFPEIDLTIPVQVSDQ